MSRIRLMLAGACLAALAGCDHWREYRGIPAGADAGLWRPQGMARADFEAQVADPADLLRGRVRTSVDAQSAVNAVERMRRERPAPLPASALSRLGQGGAPAPAAP